MKTLTSIFQSNRSMYVILSICLTFSTGCKSKSQPSTLPNEPTCYKQAAVATAHPLATQVGLDILQKGGNAFDAAIAVQFALAVVYPRAGNIGGGGFMVYYTEEGQTGALDFREKAPLSAFKDMYLDDNGDVIEGASVLGHRSVAVPGVVDGMWRMHEKMGALSWAELINPAIKLASDGYTLTKAEAAKLNNYQESFLEVNTAEMPFVHQNAPWQTGDSIMLPDLSDCLIRIRDEGRAGFYKGRTAELLLAEIKQGEGYLIQEDLDSYTSRWMETVQGNYRGYEVHSMPPPSSGGIVLIQLLKGAESYDIAGMGSGSAQSIHLMAELERRAYADRATHLGDPEFWDVPVDMLLNDSYIKERNSTIDLRKTTDSQDIKEGDLDIVIESVETTHFSIVDAKGNAVSLTTTLNGNYGSKVMVDGAQFFLNNEMDDFSVKPGVPNMYGLVGGEANAIEAEKRMLSSMTPTIVLKDGKVFLILGTPGGSTIITSVFQVILNIIDHQMSIAESVASPRWHHQWLPDLISYEEVVTNQLLLQELEDMGHNLQPRNSIGRVDAIHFRDDNCIQSVGDNRGDDVGSGF
jgi:gamma-glutamyltranspeptidase/glutathione hydrolase